MVAMANPEMMVLNSGWMPLAVLLLLVIGLLLALRMTASPTSNGDRS
jgi:hypothetical protein